MKLLTSLTKKLIAVSGILLVFLSVFIYSVWVFSYHAKSDAERINLASQLRYLSFEMAWRAQRLVERKVENLDPSTRETYINTFKNEIATFDQLCRGLKKGDRQKGINPLEYKDIFPEVDAVVDEWNNTQRPALTKLLELPADAPEEQGRAVLIEYDRGIYAYVSLVDKIVGFLEDNYRDGIEEFTLFMFVVLGSFCVALVLIGFYVRQFIVKPVRRLRDSAKEIQCGNFDVTVDAKTSDELGELSTAFNIMTGRLTEIFAEAEKRANDILAINVASNNMIGISDPDRLYKTICEGALKIYDLKLVWLCLVEEGTFALHPVAQAGSADEYLAKVTVRWDETPEGNGPTGMAIKMRSTRTIPFIEDEPSYAPWIEQAREHGIKSVLALPLICLGNEVVGALNLYSDKPGFFDMEKTELMQIYANQAAGAIDNARMISGLEKAIKERTLEIEDAQLIAESANLSKSNFLASMSHELRTPLNVIIGFSEALASGIYGEIRADHAEYIGHILKSGVRLLTLINSIMELARIDIGSMVLDYSECIITEIIGRSTDMFREKAKKHLITLEADIGEGLLTFIVDRNKITYVLVTLLTHALQNTPDGGMIYVRARKMNETQTEMTGSAVALIELMVEDTGPAIGEEERESVFSPFGMKESPLAGGGEGLRVGFALCKRFVEAHGGSIRVENRPVSERGNQTEEFQQKGPAAAGDRIIFVLPQRPSHDKLIKDAGKGN